MKINFKSMLLLVGVSLIMSVPCASAHTDVTPEEAYELIGSTDDLTVIDVREPSEYCSTRGHIPGALNYPLSSGVLYDRYEELPMDGPILVVCQSGGRSNQAAMFLDSKGFSIVYDMMGGMSAWIWETELCVEPEEKYNGGTGESNDPYLIYTAEQLNAIGAEPNDWDKHFKLMADIDLSDYTGTDFNIIGVAWNSNFTGVFDGNNHTISNFNYNSTGQAQAGLFGWMDDPNAQIINLGLIDPNIQHAVEGNNTGSLVGFLWEGTLRNCYVKGGTVTGYEGVGALVGYNNGWMYGCYSAGTAVGTLVVGGLVGSNHGRIMDCYSTCTVFGSRDIGGLVGYNAGFITNCYSIGSVDGDEDVGGLVGRSMEGSRSGGGGIEGGCFWDMETSGQAVSGGGTGKTTAEMQTTSTFIDAGWDFVGETENGTEDIWSICEGTNYPRFVWQIPTVDFVCPDGITIDDFSFFMEHWLVENCDLSNGYCDGTDLDQSGTVDVKDLEIFFENWPAEN
jgi:rhodanese-related sulfurtransferase